MRLEFHFEDFGLLNQNKCIPFLDDSRNNYAL
jgi:hypothetical protein